MLPLNTQISRRDLRLDVWRGLCIVDMILVHLVEKGLPVSQPIWNAIMDYTRFAAGGFVILSGVCVGAIHLRKANDPSRRISIYRSLLKRAGYILLVHYLVTLGFLLLVPLNHQPLLRVPGAILDVLLLRSGYDLLPFYVVMIALSPVMIEMVRRGFTWLLLLLSAIGFAIGQTHWAIFPLPLQSQFFVILWQAPFVIGLVLGSKLHTFDQLQDRTKNKIAATIACAVAILFALEFGPRFGLNLHAPFVFYKLPLSTAEMFRYLTLTIAIALSFDVYWRKHPAGRVAAFIATLGRRSLALAVFHVYLVLAILALIQHWQTSAMFSPVWIAIVLFASWFAAKGLESAARGWKCWQPTLPRFEYFAVPTGIATACVALLLLQSQPIQYGPKLDDATIVVSDPMIDFDPTPSDMGDFPPPSYPWITAPLERDLVSDVTPPVC